MFAGDVVTILFLAEKRPATTKDRIRLRVANERCAKFTGLDQKHIEFDLNKSTLVEMPYADVFAPNGRILTRINPQRKAILDRFKGPTLEEAVHTFWVANAATPSRPGRWNDQRMTAICGGSRPT